MRLKHTCEISNSHSGVCPRRVEREAEREGSNNLLVVSSMDRFRVLINY